MALAWMVPLAAAKNPAPRGSCANVCLNLADFDRAAGAPPIVIDFESMPCGLTVDGQTHCGVMFQMVRAPLEVVCAEDTYTPSGFKEARHAERCSLRATSGQMLLSPGGAVLAPGPNPAVEDDDIIMTFSPPVACVGLDHISQYADGMSYTRVKVIAEDGTVLHEGTIDIGSGRWLIEHGDQRFIGGDEVPPNDPNSTVDFWGFVSRAANIHQVRIDETDDNDVCPDSNIGIDSVRFAPFRSPCGQADLTGDGRVDSADMRAILVQFGPADPLKVGHIEWSAADVNRDGMVDSADLVELLSHTR
jgi:hypothetical protein